MSSEVTGVRGYLRARLGVLAVLGAWSLVEAGQTFLVGFAVARALDEGFLRGRDGVGLGWLGVAAVAVPMGAYGTARVFRGLAALVEPLRDALVTRVVRTGLRDAVRGRRTGHSGVISRLTHQVEIARDSFGGLVLVVRSFVFTSIGALAGMCALAPVLLLLVLPPLAAGIALFAAGLRPLARRQHAYLAADEALAEELGTLAGGLRDIIACGAEPLMTARADDRIETGVRTARALARWGVLRAAALGVGGQLPIIILLFTAPWLLSSHRLTPGALLGALTYLTQSLQPALQNLVHTLGAAGTRLGVVLARIGGPAGGETAFGAARVGAGGVGEAAGPTHPADALGVPAPPLPPAAPGTVLDFRDVTFAYGPGAEPVLRGLELTVAAGEHLAVVGPSGIGKSTLAGLAAGLLRPGLGEVRAAAAALVPQEAYVFRGTVRENLGYLRADAVPDAELAAAAAEVGADRLLAALGGPDGVLEPGELSSGERQLIALTRTYLAPAGLVLLDEATCHLDPAAEAVAEAAFARRPGGTLVVIAHRISSARRADRVLVLDGARAVCGTHEDLPARSPLYRDLVGGWSPPAATPYGAEPHPAGPHPAGPLPSSPGTGAPLPAGPPTAAPSPAGSRPA